jgi:hypothetical protein
MPAATVTMPSSATSGQPSPRCASSKASGRAWRAPCRGELRALQGRTHRDARPTRQRTSSRNTPPARPVRGRPWKTNGYTDRETCADAVRYTSVAPATQRPTALQGDTRRDKGKTARVAENSQLAGRFRRWWQVSRSNQCTLRRDFLTSASAIRAERQTPSTRDPSTSSRSHCSHRILGGVG